MSRARLAILGVVLCASFGLGWMTRSRPRNSPATPPVAQAAAPTATEVPQRAASNGGRVDRRPLPLRRWPQLKQRADLIDPEELDPIELHNLSIPVQEIVAQMPRDDAWATEAESLLDDEFRDLMRAMMIDAEDVSVTCSRLACQIDMMVTPDQAKQAFSRMQAFPAPLLQPYGEIAPDGRHNIGIRLLYDRQWSGATGFHQRLRAALHERFPDGYDALRDYLEKHPEAD
jgi:hypothetical protein